MHVTYTARFAARCPANPRTADDYAVVVEADAMIKVEDLLEVLHEYRTKPAFQEEITQAIATRFAQIGKVTTTGIHSGVATVCVVEV